MNILSVFLWQAPTPPSGNGGIYNIILLVVGFAILYFLILRPQSQQRKKQTSFAASLKKGKNVVTIGGIHGVISDLSETKVELIVAPKIHLTFQRDAISMESTLAAYGQQNETANTEKRQEEGK
jgi:preprotein translocase subunit YajC